jgi:hypothetical protein
LRDDILIHHVTSIGFYEAPRHPDLAISTPSQLWHSVPPHQCGAGAGHANGAATAP